MNMRKLSDFDYMLDSYDSHDDILENLRSDFVNTFPVDYIRNNMPLSEYVEGEGSHDSFCYLLEFVLNGLGSIKGSSAKKFGIYYSARNQKYVINKVWQTPHKHPNINQSFEKLRSSLADLIEAGVQDDQNTIEKNPLALTIKLKILSIYYPQKYLNIFSTDMLRYFLYQFYGDALSPKISIFEQQKLLLRLKQEDKATKNWNNIKFGNYLYHLFPEAADIVKKGKNVKFKQVIPEISSKAIPKFQPVVHNKKAVKFKARKSKLHNETRTKSDYIELQINKSKIGELGETTVIEYERKRLANYPKLKRKVKWQSHISDAIGYDILSFEEDGTPRQIEVKSTSGKPSNKFDFIMTENERRQALTLPNYWIYKVFNVNDRPVIYTIKNPIKDNLAELQPIKYRVKVKVKNKE